MPYTSRLAVSTAATDRKLISSTDVEAAFGTDIVVSDTLLLQISDAISRECRVPEGFGPTGPAVPTLRSETLVETFRRDTSAADGAWPYGETPRRETTLFLSRMPVNSITSVVADGTTLAVSNYEVIEHGGRLIRLYSDAPISWASNKIVVTYVAGYATVPEDLKLAALAAAQEKSSSMARDPLLRAETHEGYGTFQYALSTRSDTAFSASVLNMLAPYRYQII